MKATKALRIAICQRASEENFEYIDWIMLRFSWAIYKVICSTTSTTRTSVVVLKQVSGEFLLICMQDSNLTPWPKSRGVPRRYRDRTRLARKLFCYHRYSKQAIMWAFCGVILSNACTTIFRHASELSASLFVSNYILTTSLNLPEHFVCHLADVCQACSWLHCITNTRPI